MTGQNKTGQYITKQRSTAHYRTIHYKTRQHRTLQITIPAKREEQNMKTKTVELKRIEPKTMIIHIEGTTDLVLNKMNAHTIRTLTDARKDKAKNLEKPNEWEQVITAMHWRDGTPKDFSEEGLYQAFKDNAPCISAFGLKKSFGEAVVRNEIDKYKTKFDANVNIIAPNNLIPIKFTGYELDEKLMSPKKGSPVLVRLNRFIGWSADIVVQYLDNVYSEEQIINIVNLAGFGLGIGSGRTSGYGRYSVTAIS